MKISRIDNVFFTVLDLAKATSFYQRLGFKQKLQIPSLQACLLSIGNEEPGLILCQKKTIAPSKLWIEVESTKDVKSHCDELGILGKELETQTGFTYELIDYWGNTIGFADYSKHPRLSHEKIIAEQYTERVWNKKDLTAIDEFVDENVVIHSLLGDFEGIRAMKDMVSVWLKGFPDLKVVNNGIVGEDSRILVEWQAKGTHQGEFKGKKPTHKPVSYSGVTTYQFKDGLIVNYKAYVDMQNLMNQIK